jgi:regulator of sirC expression with transglutaminase-like and TPR domain
MARELRAALPENADDAAKLAALKKFLFEEYGFHGSRGDYYNRSNSYLNEVLDDREGLPITLSVVYMELARRIGLNVVGIGMPGQFIVAHVPAQGEPAYIDVYEGGGPVSRAELEKRARESTGQELRDEQLAPMTKQAILVRMLRNLMGIAQGAEDIPGMLRYVEAIVTLAPESPQEHWLRAVLRYQTGQKEGAAADVAWLLEHEPEGIPLERVRELRRILDRME